MNRLVIPPHELAGAVLGRNPRFTQTTAMAQLATSNRADREALLAHVMAEAGQERRHKVTAAIALGRVGTIGAEDALLRHVSHADSDVRSTIFLSLGRIGGARALDALDALDLPPHDPSAPARDFAATVIAHRLGLSGHEAPFPREADMLEVASGQDRRLEVLQLGPDATADVIESMRQQSYGIELDATTATQINCGGSTSVILLNRRTLDAGLSELSKRTFILALVGSPSRETGDYSTSYVVLARPGTREDLVEIMAHRQNGAEALAGIGELVDGRLDFDIRSVRRPGALAISLRGAIAGGQVELTETAASMVREPRKMPERGEAITS